MIQMQLTAAGLAAVTRNNSLRFTRFVAGKGTSTQEAIAQACQDVPITNSQIFVAGQSYSINGQQVTVDYNAVEVSGTLSTIQASEPYRWTELALMASEGGNDEITFAYGSVVNNAFYIDPNESVTYVIPFSVIFSDEPNITVNTTENGVPWATFLTHAASDISTGVHGLSIADGDLSVNGQSLGLATKSDIDARTRNVIGIDMVTDVLPSDVMNYVGKTAYVRSSQSYFICQYRERIRAGVYIRLEDGVWQQCNSSDEGAMLVIADENIPGENEITWSEAQSNFCAWVPANTVSDRLQSLENSDKNYLRFKNTDGRSYNTEWVNRMTGAGTEASPYLIYTPYDLNNIRNDPNACYRLMNNIDLTEAIGIPVSVISGELLYGDVNSDAPLYNNGRGWIPVPRFKGVLNGNGHAIRGLVCASDETFVGMMSILEGATISNLVITDSHIISTRSLGKVASIAGRVGSQSSFLTNVVSYATIYSNSTQGSNWLGGLVCDNDCVSYYTNCANHGVLIARNSSLANIGGIVCNGNFDGVFVGCYNTANFVGAKVAGIAVRSKVISNCYNAGNLVGSVLCCDITGSDDPQLTNCYSLSGCATTVLGGALSESELKSDRAIDDLNANLQIPVFVAVEDSYPALDFETFPELSASMTIAVVDADSREMMSSGYTLGELVHQPNRKALSELRQELASKSTVRKATVTLISSAWQNNEQTVQVEGVTDSCAVVLIPKSADAFTYALNIINQSDGRITMSCIGTPSADITVDFIVVS